MSISKPGKRPEAPLSAFDQARDELFSHILRCGVLEASDQHQVDWFNDTMEYLCDRYDRLTEDDLAEVRRLGEVYCRPVIRNSDAVTAGN